MGEVHLVVHGHFYQPPRENPWTEEVPAEPSAAPFHDWNERITAECYRPIGWARVLDEAGRIIDIVNCYELLSFDVGPTLASWLEPHHPEVYERITGADRSSGRAIAQAYGHAILPLCNERDLRTQVRWGIADFVHRFGRRPEGMWLPEAAVSEGVLACLAEAGIAFTILGPSQIEAVRPLAGGGWAPVDRDAGAHGGVLRWRHPTEPAMGLDLVVYDGPLSHDLAFAGVSSQALVARAAAHGGLVCAATDGETFGHHHPFAERGLAYALAVEAPRRGVGVPRLADRLAAARPDHEARVRPSAWSCTHGLGRWQADCGCHTGGEPGWNQAWRAPLRAALDLLRDWSAEVMERRGRQLLADPWEARDAYVEVLLGTCTLEGFAARHVRGDLVEALTLLEAQRHGLLMYTSCGWFFNDLAGLETLQVLRYAARCIDLYVELGEPPPLERFLDQLAEAVSNRPGEGDGRSIWARHIEPSRVDGDRIAAHIALVELLGAEVERLADRDGEGDEALAGHTVERDHHRVADRGGLRVCAGTVALTHRRTRRRTRHAFAALHLGGFEVFGAVRQLGEGDDAAFALDRLEGEFAEGARVTTLLRRVVEDFGPREFGLESALPDAQGQIVRGVVEALMERVAATYDQLRADHQAAFTALARSGYQLPPELRAPIEVALARRFEAALASAVDDASPGAFGPAVALARAARAEGFELNGPGPAALLIRAIDRWVDQAVATRDPEDVASALELLALRGELGIRADLARAQERVFEALVAAGDAPDDPLGPLGAALHLAVGRLARAR